MLQATGKEIVFLEIHNGWLVYLPSKNPIPMYSPEFIAESLSAIKKQDNEIDQIKKKNEPPYEWLRNHSLYFFHTIDKACLFLMETLA